MNITNIQDWFRNKNSAQPGRQGPSSGGWNPLKLTAGISLVLIAILVLARLSPFSVVPPGHRGVVVLFGSVAPQPLDEGLHLVNPLCSVEMVDVRLLRADSSGEAASKDLQTVDMTVTINYTLEPQLVAQLYSSIGLAYTPKVIDPATQEVFKAVASKFSAEELITKREDVREQVKRLLDAKIAAASNSAIRLNEVSITNFTFSKKFSAAIESKQEAEQLALKASRDLERIQIEAKQRVATAEAEAAALRAQKQEITPDLLRLREIDAQLKAVEKWNGILPTTIAGGAVPFIGVPQQSNR